MFFRAASVADAGARIAGPHVPEPNRWPDTEARNKVDAMDRLARTGGASVVFAGSSMINVAADPLAIGAVLGNERPVFNAALNGSDMRLMDAWITGVVLPRLHPQTVVLGMAARDLNEHGVAQNVRFNAFASSPAGKQVLGDETLVDSAERRLESASALFRYRTSLRRPWTAIRGERRDPGACSPLGVLEALPLVNQVPYRISPAFRMTTVDGFRDYAIGPAEVAAVRHIATVLALGHIRLVVVSMPVTDDVIDLHPGGRPRRISTEEPLPGPCSRV